MPLILDVLKSGLETGWLVGPGGSYPASPNESGDRFAGAVTNWFSAAQAAGFPCATAAARRSQLASTAGAALASGASQAAGAALALAVGGYIAGQLFGVGVASFPATVGLVGAQLGAIFEDRGATSADRAQQIALACTTLAMSTLVVFPAPPFSAPVT
jgi:hypothetical protein